MRKRALNFTFSKRHINLAEILIMTYKKVDPYIDIHATYVTESKNNVYTVPDYLPTINLYTHIEPDTTSTYRKDILQSNGEDDRNPFHNTWLTSVPKAAFTSRVLLYKKAYELFASKDYDQVINSSCDRFILNFENLRKILNSATPGTVTALYEDVTDPRDFIPDMLFHKVDINTIPMKEKYTKILCTGFEIYNRGDITTNSKIIELLRELTEIEPADWAWEQYHLVKSLQISLLGYADRIDPDLFKKTFFTNLSFTAPAKHGEGTVEEHDEDHNTNHGAGVEWSGMFEIKDITNKWLMQKVGNKYADPAMRVVIVKTDSISKDIMERYKPEAQELILNGPVVDLNSGEAVELNNDITCLNLIVNTEENTSSFTVKSSNAKNYAIYTQHVPYEFEQDQHFFKTSASVDIEPVLEDGGSGHHHHHNVVKETHELTNMELIDRILDHLKEKDNKFQVFHSMTDEDIQGVISGVEQLKSII